MMRKERRIGGCLALGLIAISIVLGMLGQRGWAEIRECACRDEFGDFCPFMGCTVDDENYLASNCKITGCLKEPFYVECKKKDG